MSCAGRDLRVIIIAGPNGAGKTTFATQFLPNEAACPRFINADMIAAGLSPYRPETMAVRAGRLLLEQIHRYVRQGLSFAFETTLSGKLYARLIPQWREMGYCVELLYLQLPTSEMAVHRVRSRVREGGHAIPEQVIHRRFDAGLRNFHHLYKPLVDTWAIYDNSGSIPVLLERG